MLDAGAKVYHKAFLKTLKLHLGKIQFDTEGFFKDIEVNPEQ